MSNLTQHQGSCLPPPRSNNLAGGPVFHKRQQGRNSTHGLGGNTTNLPLAVDIAPLPATFFSQQTYSGLQNFSRPPVANSSVPKLSKRTPSSWDWRSQGGVSWLTGIRDQGCEDCWAFASAALIETQTRIEQGYWDKRSEGDIRDGWKQANGNPESDYCQGDSAPDALNWVVNNGVTDLQCFPYDGSVDQYTPCVDRKYGRTTRIPQVTYLNIADNKDWIADIGPIITWLNVDYNFWVGNFDPTEVYYSPPNPTYPPGGGAHYLLIVGYDDNLGAWIIRNSWGTDWGDNGYALLGYGQLQTDDNAKIGLQFANPDPWIKRRLHNGNTIVSGDGATHKNFELIRCTTSGDLLHQWRQGGENGDFSWHDAETIGTSTACKGMPALTSTSYNRNFEFIYWEESGYLRDKYYDQNAGQWYDGGEFTDGNVKGYPGFIQGNYLDPGNLELVVRHNDRSLRHWYRQNGDWQMGGVVLDDDVKMSGPSLVQANVGVQGNFYVVAVMKQGTLKMMWRNNDDSSMPWLEGEEFGSGFEKTPPVMIQSNYGTMDENAVGNFELLVAKDGQVEHWRRDNSDLTTQVPQGGTSGPWELQATFGSGIKHVWSLLQGPFYQNMEAIVELDDGLGTLQHWYWVVETAQWTFDVNLPS